jgi:hypothetical protein
MPAFLQDGGRDFVCFNKALHVLVVVEEVFWEEPIRAALAFVVPLGVFVDLLACKIYDPRFICEHAYFRVGEFIFDKHTSFIVSPLLLLLSTMPVIIQLLVSASTSRSQGWRLFL